jgi:hypothetical protein
MDAVQRPKDLRDGKAAGAFALYLRPGALPPDDYPRKGCPQITQATQKETQGKFSALSRVICGHYSAGLTVNEA